MWISVRSILFTFSSHPEAPETAKSERQPSTYTPRWVFHGEAILLLLLFPFMPTATLGRRASKRVGVHGDSDINKPASKTVQILPVTLHLLPVVLTVRACTFCFRGHNRSLMRGSRICCHAAVWTKSMHPWYVYLYTFFFLLMLEKKI